MTAQGWGGGGGESRGPHQADILPIARVECLPSHLRSQHILHRGPDATHQRCSLIFETVSEASGCLEADAVPRHLGVWSYRFSSVCFGHLFLAQLLSQLERGSTGQARNPAGVVTVQLA